MASKTTPIQTVAELNQHTMASLPQLLHHSIRSAAGVDVNCKVNKISIIGYIGCSRRTLDYIAGACNIALVQAMQSD